MHLQQAMALVDQSAEVEAAFKQRDYQPLDPKALPFASKSSSIMGVPSRFALGLNGLYSLCSAATVATHSSSSGKGSDEVSPPQRCPEVGCSTAAGGRTAPGRFAAASAKSWSTAHAAPTMRARPTTTSMTTPVEPLQLVNQIHEHQLTQVLSHRSRRQVPLAASICSQTLTFTNIAFYCDTAHVNRDCKSSICACS